MQQRSEQTTHSMRLSIDVRAIKDHNFTAQFYVKYASIAELGVRHFKSSPAMPLTTIKMETSLNNCFGFYNFEASSTDLQAKLTKELKIELWHNQRHRDDVMLGVATVQLKDLLDRPLKKLNDSYARVYDAYIPADELNQQGKPVKTIAALRVLIYLQDLGPVGLVGQANANKQPIRNFLQEQNTFKEAHLPSENIQGIVDDRLRFQLSSLQQQVVWQLQLWKKSQENRTRLTLRQKEIEFWTGINQQQKKRDIEKQKQFKQIQAALNQLDSKMKAKMSELMKRQQKIVVFEQELQNKITEVSRECLKKDEEIERIKQKAKQDKQTVQKEKSVLQLEIGKLRTENAKLKVECEQLRKQDDKSPLNQLKLQLSNKQMEIRQLSKELQKCNQIKEQYKVYYGKMKDQVILLRGKLQEKQDAIKECKYEKELALNNTKHLEKQLEYQRIQHNKVQQMPYTMYERESEMQDTQLNERDRMIRDRQNLIDQGLYNQHDDLIREYDRNIASLL